MSAVASNIATVSTGAAAPRTTGKKELDSNDFVKLLITQLQNQDPTKPMSNSELLQQVSQIGQLESQQSLEKTLTANQDSLNTTLNAMNLQNQIGSASNMIGKQVTGTDANGASLRGIVTAINVSNGIVNLQLDSGKTLPMGNVREITAVD